MNRAIWDEAMDALWNSGVSQGRRRHDGRTCGCPPCGGSCLEGERQKEREETIQSIRSEIERRLREKSPPEVVMMQGEDEVMLYAEKGNVFNSAGRFIENAPDAEDLKKYHSRRYWLIEKEAP